MTPPLVNDDPDTNRSSIAERLLALGILLVILAWCVFFALRDPTTMPGWFHCPFHRATGLYCPGCGSTRATHHLLNAEVLTSLRHHPLLLPVGVPAAVILMITSLRTLGVRIPEAPAPARGFAWCAIAIAGALTLLWVLRNIPVEAFEMLRPPA